MKTVRSTALWLLVLFPLLSGFGGSRPFHVAPFVAAGSDYTPGAWVSSTNVSSEESVNVVVMATWCGHCERMLKQLSTNGEARDRVDMVLFFDTEYADAMGAGESGRHLVHPERLGGLGLPLYFAKRTEFSGLVSGYPTLLSCTREGCRRLSRKELGLG